MAAQENRREAVSLRQALYFDRVRSISAQLFKRLASDCRLLDWSGDQVSPPGADLQRSRKCASRRYGFVWLHRRRGTFLFRPTFRLASGRRKAGLHGRIVLLLPAVLILASIGALFRYIVLVQDSISVQRDQFRELGVEASQLGAQDILARSDLTNIPNGTALVTWYLTAFLTAETN